MTPLQELTQAKLSFAQLIHFTGILAVDLDAEDGISRLAWDDALEAAKGYGKGSPS